MLLALRKLLPNFPFENVATDVPYIDDWKTPAIFILEACDCLICIIGENTFQSEPVNWEIREAHRLGKPIVVTSLSEKNIVPASCLDLHIEVILWDASSVAGRIAELLIPRSLFENHDWSKGPPEPSTIYAQYNLMVQSWEALIARRQTVNTLYLSAESALLAGIGALISSGDKMGNIWAALSVSFLGFLGAALGFNWRRIILSYGILSRAKSKVVTALESFLPAKLFDTEWRVLEAKRYKSTTETDTQTAQFFFMLFLLIFLVAIGLMLAQIIKM